MNPNFVAKKEIKILVKLQTLEMSYMLQTLFKLSNNLKDTYTKEHSLKCM